MDTLLNIFWFRRDLRLNDNHGLFKALSSGRDVLPVFIFDNNILDELPAADRRVNFIYDRILQINALLKDIGRQLLIFHGKPEEIFTSLFSKYDVGAIYTNNDYEPYAIRRDEQIKQLALKHNADFYNFKDQVIFEKEEILKQDDTPYKVFTPYSVAWKSRLSQEGLPHWPCENLLEKLAVVDSVFPPLLSDMGFETVDFQFPANEIAPGLLINYEKTRNLPGDDATSRLGLHFRFGTLSIREAVKAGHENSESWLNELIWREFFMQILYHHPRVTSQAFKPIYDHIAWRNNEVEFERWKEGRTGFPMVDAGMRELAQTGFMHNRVRMVVASFLTKHLLIDWRWGEAWFALQLLDYDLSSNNGNWQWAAGSGCDAAPYFRIFNPWEQARKFDPKEEYVKRWIPEYNTSNYPSQMVEHKEARQRCLNVYSSALKPK